MKILLTGATGFVGSALASELASRGHKLRALVRRESVHKVPVDAPYEVSTGDVLDSPACLRAAEGCDAVIHLVGIRHEAPQKGSTYEDMHTSATFNVVNAARRMRVPRFVHMSALGTNANAVSRYHKTKWESEEIVRRSGMRWTIFRPSVIFGVGDEFHMILADLVHRPVVPIVDGGKSLLQPISIQNVTAAMSACVAMPETQGEVYEAGGPDRVSFSELVEQVAKHYQVWPNYVKVSSRVMKPVVKMAQHFRGFPLSYDELLLMLEDNVCDPDRFTSTFDIQLDTYRDKVESLLETVHLKTA